MMLSQFLRPLFVPLVAFCVALSGLDHASLRTEGNNAPVVKITSPSAADKVAPDTQIPYSISVSDKEEGESKFGEIPATEVFLSVQTFKDASGAARLFAARAAAEPPGYIAIRKADCFNCHAPHTKVIGPSFDEIAAKYSTTMNIDSLADHILKGSTGRWGSAVMPAHPDLPATTAKQIVSWLTKDGAAADRDYFRGTEGSFKVRRNGNSTVAAVLLTAVYTDNGEANGEGPALSGYDRQLLRVARQ